MYEQPSQLSHARGTANGGSPDRQIPDPDPKDQSISKCVRYACIHTSLCHLQVSWDGEEVGHRGQTMGSTALIS